MRHRLWLSIAITATLLCSSHQGRASEPAVPVAAIEPTRSRIYAALQQEQLLHPERQLAHYSHACSLLIDGASYPVVNLYEVVPGGKVAHSVVSVIVLSPSLRRVAFLENLSRDTEALFCLDNRLYLSETYGIGNAAPYGNVLQFKDRGRSIAVIGQIEPMDFPLPLTKARRQPPQ